MQIIPIFFLHLKRLRPLKLCEVFLSAIAEKLMLLREVCGSEFNQGVDAAGVPAHTRSHYASED